MQGIQFVPMIKAKRSLCRSHLRKYGKLWEDVYDSLTARKRAKEPWESLQAVKKRLIKQME